MEKEQEIADCFNDYFVDKIQKQKDSIDNDYKEVANISALYISNVRSHNNNTNRRVQSKNKPMFALPD